MPATRVDERGRVLRPLDESREKVEDPQRFPRQAIIWSLIGRASPFTRVCGRARGLPAR